MSGLGFVASISWGEHDGAVEVIDKQFPVCATREQGLAQSQLGRASKFIAFAHKALLDGRRSTILLILDG